MVYAKKRSTQDMMKFGETESIRHPVIDFCFLLHCLAHG